MKGAKGGDKDILAPVGITVTTDDGIVIGMSEIINTLFITVVSLKCLFWIRVKHVSRVATR